MTGISGCQGPLIPCLQYFERLSNRTKSAQGLADRSHARYRRGQDPVQRALRSHAGGLVPIAGRDWQAVGDDRGVAARRRVTLLWRPSGRQPSKVRPMSL